MMNSVEVNLPLRSPVDELQVAPSLSSSSNQGSTPLKRDHFEKIPNDVVTGAILPYLRGDKKLYESLALVSRKYRQMIGAFLPARSISLSRICNSYAPKDYSRRYLYDEENILEEFKENLSKSLSVIVDAFTKPYCEGETPPRRALVLDSCGELYHYMSMLDGRIKKFFLEEIVARCARNPLFFHRIDVQGLSYLEILNDFIKQDNLEILEELVFDASCSRVWNINTVRYPGGVDELLNEFFGSNLFKGSSLKKLAITSGNEPQTRHGPDMFFNRINNMDVVNIEMAILRNLSAWNMPELEYLSLVNIPNADRCLNDLSPMPNLDKLRFSGVFDALDISVLVASFADKFPALNSVKIKVIGPISRVPAIEQVRERLPLLRNMHILQIQPSDGRAPERLVDVLRF